MKSRKQAYERIADRVIECLDKGSIPWRKSWTSPNGMHRNAISGRPYRGTNILSVAITSMAEGYGSPLWLTYKQAKAAGGNIVKGQHGTPVVFWKPGNKYSKRNPETGETEDRTGLLCIGYTVFNIEQTEGVKLPARETEKPAAREHEPIDAIDRIMFAYVNAGEGPTCIHSNSFEAYYKPSKDWIMCPAPARFESPEAYYATLAHEAGHSTGHGSRLARPGVTDPTAFGTHQYGCEELVAEMTSCMLLGIAGVETEQTVSNAGAYLRGWIETIKEDPKIIMSAAQRAQKAADLILECSATNEVSEVSAEKVSA